ncbi:YihY/virulence factor BrkB family protein [Natrarchaeobaculum aegyptiacum]|uniref:Uncharacterized protein n=1 Tax=Natrarchaeobaculum aegyptiacum TaxID=745377 RepID=A0A2Z2HN61_9EURY|nr:YhjD/YihY/BrkB family envelope integrity protein [Natrarchaeobaculum aegyptiacum]ARS88336.1 hypothetical protein B1756_00205 [Natrarchaeobaculum aegyptiacum]
MATSVRDALGFGKRVVDGVQETNVPFMAASIAYQAFISLLPLLVLVFFLVTIVGDEQFAASVTETTEGMLPESGQLLIEEAITDSPATAGSTLLGVVVLLWGSLKIFRGLDTAFSEIFGPTDDGSFVRDLLDALIVFGAIGGALLAAAAAGIAFAFVPAFPFDGVVQSSILVVVLVLAFFPMYYVFPDVDVSPRQVLPGVLVAAVGWMALQSLFRVYVGFAADSDAAGPIGGILLLLTWLYFGALVLLAGGVVNAVGTGHLEPSDDEDEAESIADPDREPFVDDDQVRERLSTRTERLERERDLLRNDVRAQRSRRYRLEDRVDDLESTVRDLERENERLRRERNRRESPSWRRSLQNALAHVRHVRVGSVERE